MLEVLKINRMRKLMQQYATLKQKALAFMQAGDLNKYLETLTQANKVKAMYLQTAKATIA